MAHARHSSRSSGTGSSPHRSRPLSRPLRCAPLSSANDRRTRGGLAMSRFVAAGLSFLLAVLWFDLMFDVQTRGHTGEILPPEVLASISAYYRRVTTEAHPMNRLVSTVMVLTIVAIGAEIHEGRTRWWIGWGSLAIVGIGVV